MPNYESGEINGEYIFYYNANPNENKSSSSGTLEIIRIFAGLFTIFNTLVPISIMITGEVIKTFQVNLIESDKLMKKDKDDQFKVLSTKLHEDLGNVKYIFSDKTGTLTKNEMIFRACTIFSKTFGEIEDENNHIEENSTKTNSVVKKKKSILASSFNKEVIQNSIIEGGILAIKNIEESPIKNMGQACKEFFFNITLNHNVLVESKEDESKENKENLMSNNNEEELKYQGSSPDEIVLCTAASEIGVSFINQNKDYLNIKFFNDNLKFKILQKFEYSSERKRSSIIVEDDLGNIKIYVKGSDEKILSEGNINNFSKKNLLKETKDQLDSFARVGLRTLCFAYKEIKKENYLIWEKEFNKLKQECIIDKSKNFQLEKFISKMEEDLILLGATALEDKLQDNVKIDLQEFIEGGISVWMITGDKLDTAESIGHSCRLFNDDTEVFKIKSSNKKATKECLKQIKKKIDLMKNDCKSLNKFQKQITKTNKEKETKNDDDKIISEIKNPIIASNNKIIIKEDKEKNQIENEIKEDFKQTPYKNDDYFKDISRKNSATQIENNPISSFSHQISNISMESCHPKTPNLMENKLSNKIDENIINNPQNNFNSENIENLNIDDYNNLSGKLNNLDFSKRFIKKNNDLINKSNFSDFSLNDKNQKIHFEDKYRTNQNREIDEANGIPDSFKNKYSTNDNKISYEIQQKLIFNRLNPISLSESNKKDSENEKDFDNFSHNSNLYSVEGDEFSGKNPTNENNKFKNINSVSLKEKEMREDKLKPIALIRKSSYSPNLNHIDIKYLLDRKVSLFSNKENDDQSGDNEALDDISDSEILKYLADNHLFDEGEGNIIYNPTFMGDIMKKNNNETNNKILKNRNNSKMVINRIKSKFLNNIKEQKESQINSINDEENNSSNLSNSSDNEGKTPNSIYRKKDNITPFKLDENNGKNININEININEINKISSIKLKDDQIKKNVENKLSEESKIKKNEKVKEEEKENNENAKNFKSRSLNKHQSQKKENKMDLNKMIEDLQQKLDKNEKKGNFLNIIDTKKSEDKENIQFKIMSIGLLIEGDSISHCLDEDLKDLFWGIVKNSKAVVCCRCSPKQKAEVVGFVKNESNEVTLAIGDGGNDIPMIKMADIGCGIFGKEGYQAAFNSDFAFSQFKYLKRLIYIHGRLSLLRNSYFIYFFFFKNVLFTLTQLWFCFFSGFSGQLFFDSWYLLGFNSFLTSLPIGARSIVEEDIDLQSVSNNSKGKKVNLIPEIFAEYRDSIPFHILKFFFIFISALIYSMLVYFIPYYLFQYNIQNEFGMTFTFWDHGLSSYFSIIIIHFFILFEDTYLYNTFIMVCYRYLFFIIYSVQIIILLVFIFVHESLDQGEISGKTIDIIKNFNFWLITILTSSITCTIFFIFRRFDFLFTESIINNIIQNRFEADFTNKLYRKKLEEIRKLSRSIGKFKKLYKIKNEDLDNLSDKRFKDIVDAYKRTHQIEKKNSDNQNKIPLGSMKKSRSICFDKKEDNINIFESEEKRDKNFYNRYNESKKSGIGNHEKYKFESNPSKFGK